MEGAAPYARVLEEALEKKRAHLDATVLPALRDGFRLYLSTFEGLYNILFKKGLIRQDPYKLEEKLSEIRIPSRDRYLPSELSEQMSIRLSQFHSQLDFLINYYEFSVDFMALPRLRLITSLTRYIDFNALVETSANVNNAGLAALVERVTKGTDSVAAGIVKDATVHLAELARTILTCIADLVLYQRERHKLELRTAVLPAAGLDRSPPSRDQQAAVAAIRRAAQTAGVPFSQELTLEVLAEDYPPDAAAGAELRTKVLGRLAVEEKKKEKPKAAAPAPRETLIDALRSLAAVESSLRSALKNVGENELLVSRRRLGLGERIRKLLARAAGAAAEDKVYEIEYMEESRASLKTERIPYAPFVSEVNAKARTLQALSVKSGPAFEKLKAATDDQVFDLLTKLCIDLLRAAKRLEGLAALFRSQVPPEQRAQLRGIHGELAVIRTAVSKANRQKHDYVARREEEEQFKKLGVAPNP